MEAELVPHSFHNHHHQHQQLRTSSLRIPMLGCLRPSLTIQDQDQNHFNHHQKLSKWYDSLSLSPIVLNHHHYQEKEKNKKNKKKKCNLIKEPSSPKVGCMGQVKQNSSNKISNDNQFAILRTSSTSTTTTHNTTNKNNMSNNYFKLKKLFSSNGFNYNSKSTHTTTTTRGGGGGGGGSNKISTTAPNNAKLLIHHHRRNHRHHHQDRKSTNKDSDVSSSIINVIDLDPPLPVVKRIPTSVVNDDEEGSTGSSIWKRRCGGEAMLKGLQVSTTKRPTPILLLPQPPSL